MKIPFLVLSEPDVPHPSAQGLPTSAMQLLLLIMQGFSIVLFICYSVLNINWKGPDFRQLGSLV